MKSRAARISIALMILAGGSAQAADTLPDAIEKAILRNPEILARLHEYQAADAERDIARGGLLPRVDLQAYTGRERREAPGFVTSSYNRPGAQLQLRQLLFDGFATRSDIKRLGFSRATRYFELLGNSDDIALAASQAYLDVLLYRQLADLARDNWAIHKEIVDQIERRVSAGVGRRVDLEQAFGRLALAQSNWLTESSNLHDVSQRFERIVGDAPQEQLAPPPAFADKLPAEKDLLSRAIHDNPSFRAAIANIRASRANITIQRANNLPTVELRANTGMDRNVLGVAGETNSSAVQVLLNWNLYKGGSDLARVRQSHEQMYTATDLRDKACRDIRQQTTIAWHDVNKLREQLVYLEQHQLSTEKARDAYRQQFDIGQRSLLDVLNTENELFDARRAAAHARSDLVQAQLRVLTQTHQILPAVNLAAAGGNGPEEAGATEPPEDDAVQCSTELPAVPPLDLVGAMQSRPQPAATPVTAATAAAVLTPAVPPGVPALQPLVKAWAAAWSAKDMVTFKSFYSPNFKPEQGSLDAWMELRAKRLAQAGRVDIDQLTTRSLGKNSAEASFMLRTRAAGANDTSAKTLNYQFENGQWKIVREQGR
jgi:adhesin transport system outer membrane protein